MKGESLARMFDNQVEVHQAQRPGLHTRVYFLLYRFNIEVYHPCYFFPLSRLEEAWRSKRT